LFPHVVKLHFDLEAIHQILAVGRVQLRNVPWEEHRKDAAKVPACTRVNQIFSVFSLSRNNVYPLTFSHVTSWLYLSSSSIACSIFFLVLQHRAEHLFEARLALLDTGKQWFTLGRLEKAGRGGATTHA
jgi:hypothetical protein